MAQTEWVRCKKCKEKILLAERGAVTAHYLKCFGGPDADLMELVNLIRGTADAITN